MKLFNQCLIVQILVSIMALCSRIAFAETDENRLVVPVLQSGHASTVDTDSNSIYSVIHFTETDIVHTTTDKKYCYIEIRLETQNQLVVVDSLGAIVCEFSVANFEYTKISPNGQVLLKIGCPNRDVFFAEASIRYYEVANGSLKWELFGRPLDCEFSDNGEKLVVLRNREDRTAELFVYSENGDCEVEMQFDKLLIRTVGISNSGRYCVALLNTGEAPGQTIIVDTQRKTCEYMTWKVSSATNIAFSKGNEEICAIGGGEDILMFDCASNSILWQFSISDSMGLTQFERLVVDKGNHTFFTTLTWDRDLECYTRRLSVLSPNGVLETVIVMPDRVEYVDSVYDNPHFTNNRILYLSNDESVVFVGEASYALDTLIGDD